jgi:hypothetical protein
MDTASAQALRNEGTVELILQYVGLGQMLYIPLVNTLWRRCYERVQSKAIIRAPSVASAIEHVHAPWCTSYRAVLASPSRVKLAAEHGAAAVADTDPFLIAAGKVAEIATLTAAHNLLDMPFTEDVSDGAAAAADLERLQWLVEQHDCPLSFNSVNYAAKAGSVPVLTWLKQHGADFSEMATLLAAEAGQLAALQFFAAEGIPLHRKVCEAAAGSGNIAALQFLRVELKHTWDIDAVCARTAYIGSIDIMKWIVAQYGGTLIHDELNTFRSAAHAGDLVSPN